MKPLPTPIYHITHIDNLLAIIAAGGLQAHSRLPLSGSQPTSIAYTNIQDRRARKRVPCGPRGLLHDYVPFYFAPRSPMLYTISRGNVPTCPRQEPVVHLVTTAQDVQAAGLPYVFTDGHGIMALTTYFDDLVYLDRVDWAIMWAHYWADTLEDNDRSRRRQAEFLVHDFVPWSLISEVGVATKRMQLRVEQVLQCTSHKPRVNVRPAWYHEVERDGT